MVVTGRKRPQEAQYKMREITGLAAILRTSCSFSFGDIDLAVNVKVMRSGRAGQTNVDAWGPPTGVVPDSCPPWGSWISA